MPDGRPKLVDMTAGHRTKAEKRIRKEAEQALYTGEKFHESEQVKKNAIAHKEYLRLKRLYDKIPYVDALDHQSVNRYCIEVSNQIRLTGLSEKMESKLDDCEDLDAGELVQLYKSIAGVISDIRKSAEMLIKLEDRLLLNPASRIKAIPKTPEKKSEASGIAAFRAKRAD